MGMPSRQYNSTIKKQCTAKSYSFTKSPYIFLSFKFAVRGRGKPLPYGVHGQIMQE